MILKELGILLGNKCNFRCKHCLGSLNNCNITKAEIVSLSRVINRYEIKKLLFVGGEPTLYVKEINQLISKLKNIGKKEIKITTNGSFAKDLDSSEQILKSFLRLSSVQLSYDEFHKEFLPIKNVKNLYLACKKLKINFSVILTISNPLDLALIKELRKIGKFMIGVQKVFPIGRAIINKVYYTVPSFDFKLLDKKCPNFKKIKFFPSIGFSVCTAYLMYNSTPRIREKVSHKKIEEYFRTEFYKLISNYSFKQIIKYLGLNIDFSNKKFISECDVCREVFYNYYETKI